MVDNIHLMQELLRGYSRKRVSPRCIIKIDIRKAFDTVEWSFVEEVLDGLGFPRIYIDWVLECISTPSYSVIVNGGLHGFFKGQRGLRQGDPLSPCIFVLCMEYLSRLVRARTASPDFNYHPKCGLLKITHLAFADDLMLMARGDTTSVEILMKCLRDFGAVSGLNLNVQKSNIFTAGIGDADLRQIQRDTNMEKGTLPVKYLGIPLAAENLKIVHFEALIDKVASLIKSWNGSTLTYAGRAELIRSVLQGIYCFWASIFHIPATVRSIIIKLCRNFLWGRKGALVSWKGVCLPKEEGGLGFRDYKIWNEAFLTKLLWNVQNKKDTLWIQWVNQVYLRGKSVWDWTVHQRDSALLKGMCLLKNKIIVSSGTKTGAELQMEAWFGNTEGGISNVYNHFRHKEAKKSWAGTVWCTQGYPKHSFILWLAMLGRLQTKDRFVVGATEVGCGLCDAMPESVLHIFFKCKVSLEIWNHIRLWMGCGRDVSTLNGAVKWIARVAKGRSWKATLKKVACSCTVYHIWMARNARVFEKSDPRVPDIIRTIQLQVYRAMYSAFPHILPHV